MTNVLPFLKQEIEQSIDTRWRRVVRHFSGRVAVTAPDGEQYTYQAMDEHSDQIACAIIERLGLENEPVVLFLDHIPLLIVTIIGVLKANKAYIALDPTQTTELINILKSPTGPRLVITTSEQRAEVTPATTPHQDILFLEDVGETRTPPDVEISPDALAALFFTSGTVGQPKGVPYTQRMILHRIWVETHTYQLTADDRFSGLRPCGVAASVRDIFNALLNGGTLCLYPMRQYGLGHLSTWLLDQTVTYFHLPGMLYREWLDTLPEDASFPAIRYLSPSGRKTIADCTRIWPHLGADACLINTYATTETSLLSQQLITRQTPLTENVLSVGQPVPDKHIALVDEQDQPVAAGQVGEIIVRSRFITSGYWQQPQMGAQRFTLADDGSEEIVYRTGDFGRLRSDGRLELIGRQDSQVKVHGYRVMLDDVETLLAKANGVDQAAARVFPTSGGDNRLVGYVTGLPGARLSGSTVRNELSVQATAQMIPAQIMVLPELPLTRTGKIDRQALPVPSSMRPNLDTPFRAPRNELEQQIADIWAELLELDAVGVDDNLFELGGDSLTAMRLILAVEKATGQHVSTDVFNEPTVAHLARLLSNEPAAASSAQNQMDQPKSPRHRVLSPYRQFKRMIVNGGPSWRNHALPYGLGVRMQRLWVRLPLIRQKLQQLATPFREWLTILELDDVDGRELELSLLANTWRGWREACIKKPATFAQWVTAHGIECLNSGLAMKRPIVLVGTHAAIRSAAIKMEIHQQSGHSVWTLGYSPTSATDAAAKVIHAQKLLVQGGIVQVTGDGAQGTRGVEVPIYGRPWLFRSGGAELALDTNAILLPVFNTLAHSGHITVEFLEPLTTGQCGREQQIEDLTRQYAALLTARWPYLLNNMKWGKLQQILDHAGRRAEQ